MAAYADNIRFPLDGDDDGGGDGDASAPEEALGSRDTAQQPSAAAAAAVRFKDPLENPC
jgi:hypothetical protein